jgi:NAD(P)-dependent dehydrogenase (short-subunit alcohol dehydrogenase family)
LGLVDGRSGLVTGAASGIGRATAICFAQEGASVVVNDLESRLADGQETVRLIEQAGGRAIFVGGDVASEDDQRRLVEECVSAFGRLDFAHNNAGVDLYASLEEMTVEDWNRVIDVNLKGVWLGMKHQLSQMRKQGGGSIVNTSSVAGVTAVRNIGAYVASKFGVVGLTRTAALEAGDAGIRVNCIVPSATRTEMITRLTPDVQAGLTRPHAIKRLGEPSEVAETVVWLASDRSSLVTGATLAVDLGATAGITP